MKKSLITLLILIFIIIVALVGFFILSNKKNTRETAERDFIASLPTPGPGAEVEVEQGFETAPIIEDTNITSVPEGTNITSNISE